MITFRVDGLPGTKGSVRAFAFRGAHGKLRATVVNDSKKAAPWAALVSHAAARAMEGRDPWAGPLSVAITFYLPRPKSHFKRNGELKPTAPRFVATKPDGDKLLRCSWDALTGIVFRDDSQIVEWSGSKVYGKPGATFEIVEAGAPSAADRQKSG